MTTQLSLFSDTAAKTISSKQAKPAQMDMFAQSELAQFGVHANPRMALSSGKLGMVVEDVRTAEQVEADKIKQAQEMTGKLF